MPTMLAAMRGEEFSAPVEGGHIGGWSDGSGEPVLLLHGGPGMRATYLASLADEFGVGFRTVIFQQRGLAPSMTGGPFDIPTALADIVSVLDHLGIDRTYLVGHSWGGHLAMHAAVRLADRLKGVLCVDPLGAVGDGGVAAFEAEMLARTPEEARKQAHELDERAMRGEGTEGDALESLRLVWSAYFGDPASATPMPEDMQLSVSAYSGLWESLVAAMPGLAAALPDIAVPLGFLAGGNSPMPVSVCTEAAERIPGAWVEVVDGVGHMPWMERPGCVRPALERLVAST
ncbi:MAG TPA: alpha/beta hydrolase [Mycobacteriales bacterium]|nr:alpha/beta hydrolase [Mycobacteriales bacterium]